MATQMGGDSDRGEIFDLLSNHRRRYAIHYCKREDEPVTLGDLAEHVAAWELDKEIEEITSAERKRVYTSLQQTHLPTLERAEMIEFDNRTIELTDEASELDVYLDVVPADSIPWGLYYLGLAAVGAIVMGGLWLEVVPTETVSELGWATLVFALFAVSAVVHVVQSRRMRLGEMERPP
ncbi:hypothetical protein Htur_3506 [Haloterrigena turkmenica DSM 5511]|uniref:DUF7344 domain-containing protein n=1 Tax=Haloterrigena turkmenica (strain ATCC 51198 / DSM 5511 / JCM 9101 / NCIMB 13204 / VKM B-1734 / 4k) TaxID=543526 RepID=D2RQJ1_HALTV|nr:hypothetical protein [Haloterrigena turkmenica]ADB62368.1 hypothetical protein Htur_3506 [Haloterrigena turkmenica DSM 5511]